MPGALAGMHALACSAHKNTTNCTHNRTQRLPTAHTCFNHLMLPSYRDKGTLRDRLLLAIENAEGFGLM